MLAVLAVIGLFLVIVGIVAYRERGTSANVTFGYFIVGCVLVLVSLVGTFKSGG